MPFGALREDEARLVGRRSTRKRTVVRCIGLVSTRFGEGGGRLDRRRARGVLNHCAQGTSEGMLIPDHGLHSFYESQQGAANGQDSRGGGVRDGQGFGRLDADSRTSFSSSRPPPP